jgi:hypothetical protein
VQLCLVKFTFAELCLPHFLSKSENLVHCSLLKSSGGICQPKAQHCKLKLAHWRHLRSFWLVFISGPDLVIAALKVQGRKDNATMQFIQTYHQSWGVGTYLAPLFYSAHGNQCT